MEEKFWVKGAFWHLKFKEVNNWWCLEPACLPGTFPLLEVPSVTVGYVWILAKFPCHEPHIFHQVTWYRSAFSPLLGRAGAHRKDREQWLAFLRGSLGDQEVHLANFTVNAWGLHELMLPLECLELSVDPSSTLPLVYCPILFFLWGVIIQPMLLDFKFPEGEGGGWYFLSYPVWDWPARRCSRKTLQKFDFIKVLFASCWTIIPLPRGYTSSGGGPSIFNCTYTPILGSWTLSGVCWHMAMSDEDSAHLSTLHPSNPS